MTVLRRYDRTTGQVVVLYQPTSQDRFGGAPPLAFSPQDKRTLYMAVQYVLATRHLAPLAVALLSSACPD